MTRTKAEQTTTFRCIRGGIGEAEMRQILNSSEELYGKGRLFSHVILAPGNSIGDHMHEGDNEIYYILSGSGTYNDNGTTLCVYPGDTTICNDGETHGIINDGTEPLEMIALVLYN